jgi:hypothetical protein
MFNLPVLISLLLQVQPQSPVRLYPVDETDREPAFRSYVQKLRSAVEARSTEALRKLVDDDEVFVGPADDDKGWAKFIARWRPEDRLNSPLWPALSDLLSVGFIREHPTLFLSPYVAWRFPSDLSMKTHVVVVRDKAALRKAPSPRAEVAALLSFDIVRLIGVPQQRGDGMAQWVEISTLDGLTGYVNVRDVMSPLMPRAQFALRKGRWVLIALESGGA